MAHITFWIPQPSVASPSQTLFWLCYIVERRKPLDRCSWFATWRKAQTSQHICPLSWRNRAGHTFSQPSPFMQDAKATPPISLNTFVSGITPAVSLIGTLRIVSIKTQLLYYFLPQLKKEIRRVEEKRREERRDKKGKRKIIRQIFSSNYHPIFLFPSSEMLWEETICPGILIFFPKY